MLLEATGSPAVARYFLPLLAIQGIMVVVGRIEHPVSLVWDAILPKVVRLVTSRYFTLAHFKRAMVWSTPAGCI
jgi:D-arabinose 1-dehydrogenase-like Zn-dependent alcohol dehydrogenase